MEPVTAKRISAEYVGMRFRVVDQDEDHGHLWEITGVLRDVHALAGPDGELAKVVLSFEVGPYRERVTLSLPPNHFIEVPRPPR